MRTIVIIAESCEKTTEGAYYPNVNCGSGGALAAKKNVIHAQKLANLNIFSEIFSSDELLKESAETR